MRKLIIVSILFVGCGPRAIEHANIKTSSPAKVDIVTRFNGVILYRVDDNSQIVYVAAKDNGEYSAKWEEDHGYYDETSKMWVSNMVPVQTLSVMK